MLGHREMNVDDYVQVLRRRIWLILTASIVGAVLGYVGARLLPAKYESASLVLVDAQQVPEGYVKSTVTEDLLVRLRTMQEQILSRTRLQPIIERYGLYKGDRPVTDEVVDQMRQDLSVKVIEDFFSQETRPKKTLWASLLDLMSAARSTSPNPTPMAPTLSKKGEQPVTGFSIRFTANTPQVAQEVCAEITSMFIGQNLQQREQAAQGTVDFVAMQLAGAKQNLDAQDAKLADFKRRYMGALPDEQQTNLQLLQTLNTQLGSVSDQVSRAQLDKTYVEADLQQEVAAWKASQPPASSEHLRANLAQMQTKLAELEGQYTSDHPSVIKAKRDVAQLEKTIAEQAAHKGDDPKPPEPTHVLQMRAQLQQDEEQIRVKSKDQEHLQQRISLLEAHLQLTPAVERQYKELTRDYKTALQFYTDLLNKQQESTMATDLERRQEAQRFVLLDPAALPAEPSFPDNSMFVLGGLGGGVVLGLGWALLLEFRDKSLRNARDVEFLLGLPALAMVPLLGDKKRLTGRWASKARLGARQPFGT